MDWKIEKYEAATLYHSQISSFQKRLAHQVRLKNLLNVGTLKKFLYQFSNEKTHRDNRYLLGGINHGTC